MRRPLVFAAVCFGLGIFSASVKQVPPFVWLTAGLLGAAAAAFLGSAGYITAGVRKKMLLAVCIFLAGNFLFQFDERKPDGMAECAGRQTSAAGMVTEIQQKEDSCKLTVDVFWEESRGRIDPKSKLLVNYYGVLKDPQRMVGKTVKLSGKIELPEGAGNPGTFDYRNYLKSLNIFAVMKADSVEIIDNERPLLLKWTGEIKAQFSKALAGAADKETAGLIKGMMFGDKSGLDPDVYRIFQENGTAHILAVSGLHIGVIYGFIQKIWGGRKSGLFYWSALLILFFYTALASFSPSVIRAASMIALHIFAELLHRRYDLLSAAGLVFIVMLCIEPGQLFLTGFQLSFLAIVSLGIFIPAFSSAFADKFTGKAESVFLPGAAIQAGMTPYMIYLFHTFSASAFFLNIPVIFAAGLLIPIGLLLIPLSFGPGILFSVGAWVMKYGCKAMIFCNEAAYMEGKTVFTAAGPPLVLLMSYYGIVFCLCSEKGRILLRRKQWKPLVSAALAIVIFSSAFHFVLDDGWRKAEILFLDVGQGDCLLIKTSGGRAFLIDGGGSAHYDVGKNVLKPYLLHRGIRKIDAAFVSHLHMDHYEGIKSLAREGMIASMGLYEGNRALEDKICRETGLKPKELLYLYKGQKVVLGEDVFLEILWPERKTAREYDQNLASEDENMSSLIIRVVYKGVRILMTGDIDTQGEAALVEQYGSRLKTDILKIAHHGSKYSSSDAFFEAADPRIAVIQVGKNNFGHPSEAVVEKCRQTGIIMYRNDRDGAVGIWKDSADGGIHVKTMAERENLWQGTAEQKGIQKRKNMLSRQ